MLDQFAISTSQWSPPGTAVITLPLGMQQAAPLGLVRRKPVPAGWPPYAPSSPDTGDHSWLLEVTGKVHPPQSPGHPCSQGHSKPQRQGPKRAEQS